MEVTEEELEAAAEVLREAEERVPVFPSVPTFVPTSLPADDTRLALPARLRVGGGSKAPCKPPPE